MVVEIERLVGLVTQQVFVILKEDRKRFRGQIALWVRLPVRSRPKGHCCQVIGINLVVLNCFF